MDISWKKEKNEKIIYYRTLSFVGVWNKSILFLEHHQFHNQTSFFDFFSYFHDWILNLKLYVSRFEWTYFININFMICFNLYLDQDIGLKLCIYQMWLGGGKKIRLS
jgi:hypothetical protein